MPEVTIPNRVRSDTADFLARERIGITTAAEEILKRRRQRQYAAATDETVRQRLDVLYDHLVSAVSSQNLASVVAYTGSVAEERFQSGYDLSDVQAAFNALEDATWRRILAEVGPADHAEALGLVSTVFGAAKDELARRYVSLATRTHATSLDLTALLGTGARWVQVGHPGTTVTLGRSKS